MPKGVFRRTPRPPAERFWSKVRKTDGCWLWTGNPDRDGYGQFRRGATGSKTIRAHHFAWEEKRGPVPAGMDLCHTCDTPNCVRNDDEGTYEVDGLDLPRQGHLFLGTNRDNQRDKQAKGRGIQGETAGRAKLTEADVRTIRLLAAQGYRRVWLARKFGVTPALISGIVLGRLWRHV